MSKLHSVLYFNLMIIGRKRFPLGLCYDRKFSCSFIRMDSNISRLVSKVLNRTSQIDVMVTTIPQTIVSEQVKILLSLDAHPNKIVDLYVTKPVLMQSKTLVLLVNTLKSYGIENEVVVKLISKKNNFHNTNPEKIRNCFECLRKLGLSNEDILNLFLKNQEIIHVSVKDLNMRLNELKELFSAEHSLQLMKTMPLILNESIADIKEKFMYVHYSMGMSQQHMISASLFQYPLKHVRERHVFLERAGLFQKPKRNNQETKSTNPPLKDIIDTSDGKFVKMFSKTMTTQDFTTFCKLMEKEIDLSLPKQTDMDSDMQ